MGRRALGVASLLVVLSGFGCGSSSSGDAGADASRLDGSVGGDAASIDASARDAEASDAPPADAEPIDAGPVDAEASDAEAPDAEANDAAAPDAEVGDAEAVDAKAIDANAIDAEPLDANAIDAEPLDANAIDAEPIDGAPIDAEPIDAGEDDAGEIDAGEVDAGAVDAGPADAEPLDAAATDAEPPDAGVATGTVADSAADFSDTQGQNNWYYGYVAPATSPTFQPMTEFSSGVWAAQFGVYWTSIRPQHVHPNGTITSGGRTPVEHWAVRRWVSPFAGTISISSHVAKSDTAGGNGVLARIERDGVQLWSQFIAFNDGVGYDVTRTTTVSAGSTVDFILEPYLSNDLGDTTIFETVIEAVP